MLSLSNRLLKLLVGPSELMRGLYLRLCSGCKCIDGVSDESNSGNLSSTYAVFGLIYLKFDGQISFLRSLKRQGYTYMCLVMFIMSWRVYCDSNLNSITLFQQIRKYFLRAHWHLWLTRIINSLNSHCVMMQHSLLMQIVVLTLCDKAVPWRISIAMMTGLFIRNL